MCWPLPTAAAQDRQQAEDGEKEVVSNKVLVKNLPWKATEQLLQKDFQECGKIVSIRLPTNDDGSCVRCHVLMSRVSDIIW